MSLLTLVIGQILGIRPVHATFRNSPNVNDTSTYRLMVGELIHLNTPGNDGQTVTNTIVGAEITHFYTPDYGFNYGKKSNQALHALAEIGFTNEGGTPVPYAQFIIEGRFSPCNDNGFGYPAFIISPRIRIDRDTLKGLDIVGMPNLEFGVEKNWLFNGDSDARGDVIHTHVAAGIFAPLAGFKYQEHKALAVPLSITAEFSYEGKNWFSALEASFEGLKGITNDHGGLVRVDVNTEAGYQIPVGSDGDRIQFGLKHKFYYLKGYTGVFSEPTSEGEKAEEIGVSPIPAISENLLMAFIAWKR